MIRKEVSNFRAQRRTMVDGYPTSEPALRARMISTTAGVVYFAKVSVSGGSSSLPEQRLCEAPHLNLAYRGFCRLSLEEEAPNHSRFSKNRHGRFRDSDLFSWLFNEVLRRCMDAGLVKGESFAVDASIIKADATRPRGVSNESRLHAMPQATWANFLSITWVTIA